MPLLAALRSHEVALRVQAKPVAFSGHALVRFQRSHFPTAY
jgi:hypothetical protein